MYILYLISNNSMVMNAYFLLQEAFFQHLF